MEKDLEMSNISTLIEFVDYCAEKYSEHTYLREKLNGEWQETSFAYTRLQARQIAAGLMQLGLQKGDKVALLSEGRNLWVTSELGILYAAGINVPLSIKLEESNDLLFRIQHSETRFIIVSGLQLPKIRRILSDIPAVERIIVLDSVSDPQDKEICINEVIASGRQFLKDNEEALNARSASVQPDDYASISYTSGTTAAPKGTLLTHRNYTTNVRQARSVIGVEVDDIMLVVLPLDHCFAHVAGMYTMMSYGGSIATAPVGKTALATLRNIPQAIKEVRPHVMLMVPALARSVRGNIEKQLTQRGKLTEMLYHYALHNAIIYNKEYWNRGTSQCWRKPLLHLFDKLVFEKVRAGLGGRMKWCVGGGASLDIELQRFFCAIGIPIYQGYGQSEATPIISSNSPDHAVFGSSGRPVKPMDIKILDSDGQELKKGEKGEIVVRGDNVMAGYWKNPQSTAETVVEGWLHTGDMGYIESFNDEDYLFVMGRFKSLLISSDGEKYSPEGFEDALTDNSPFIEQCLLHNNQNPYTIALIVPNKDRLHAYLRRRKLKPDTVEGKQMMLRKIQEEVDQYRKGGRNAGMFPEVWLPKAIVILPEPLTEENHFINSTMKIVRHSVVEHYKERIEYAYTIEGKELINSKNIESL